MIARDGRKVSYGELTALAASLPKAPTAAPKTSKDFKIIGKPQTRENAEKIAQGKAPAS